MNRTFLDKAGRTLVFSESEAFGVLRISIKFGKYQAAYANACNEGTTLKLADIFVAGALRIREKNRLKRLFGKPTFINFRRQGLGSMLLERILDYARTNGFKRIEGRLANVGLDPDLDLPEWYRKRGFAVEGSKMSTDLA